MSKPEHFRISAFLKDVLGRALVTNEFVAVFELVKNSLDAGAGRVDIVFDLDADTVWIVDDGAGMSPVDLRDKWLWVAYSAKREEMAERDYRDRIDPYPRYAGSKGIGRFSVDTLGRELRLYTRAAPSGAVAAIEIAWSDFEGNARDEFQNVPVEIKSLSSFPNVPLAPALPGSGTILEVVHLRHDWNASALDRLRSYLEKLIDPFGTSDDVPICLSAAGGGLTADEAAGLSGPVSNDIAEMLRGKTTRIAVEAADGIVETALIDRGLEVFRIREPAEFEHLAGISINVELFYLNRSAKHTFAQRMKVRAHDFGSIFLFLNGFRVFPIGEPDDDTFGISARKQQGTARNLGTRDVMGRVDVSAPPGLLKEASSRDAGLIEGPESRELFAFVVAKAIRRLQRYVVDVNWRDKLDTDRLDPSGLRSEAARARIIGVVQAIAGQRNVELVSFDPEIVDVLDERAHGFEKAMLGLAKVAEATGDEGLLARVEAARARQIELERLEREAREGLEAAEAEAEAARREARLATAARDTAVARMEIAERQALILDRTGTREVSDLEVFHHQARVYAAEAASIGRRAIKKVETATKEIRDSGGDGRIISGLEDASHLVSDLLLYLGRIEMVGGLAIQAAFSLDSGRLTEDAVAFLADYVGKVLPSTGGPGFADFDDGDLSHRTEFDPIGLALVVDNLVSNSRRAGASTIHFRARKLSPKSADVVIEAWDEGGDGLGIADPDRIFEKGYTTRRRGTGLGLYHARQAMEAMDGGLSLAPDRADGEARFLLLLPPRKQGKK
ncbi:ATP-binding protein [Aurantimonas marianensis]|uniref:ATP-binding protein n=1 Tax=Aurantimonas marianensis TaxID=2920428 RepID=A0A9X2H9Y1_9HYPH|nr:ATP-binding protein [Aurantimonas marianensis]MCP3056210.1 ATP-binding protein [Aurantimonas marianensis]